MEENNLTNLFGRSQAAPPDSELESRLEKLIREKGIGGGGVSGDITIDDYLSSTSTNPVQNKVIYSALQILSDSIDNLASIPDYGVDNPNNIFNLTRAADSNTKQLIGIYRQGSTNIPDNDSDWIIISFIDYVESHYAEQVALSSGVKTCKISLRSYTTNDGWSNWDKIAMMSDIPEGSSVEINSKEEDGIVTKGDGNPWNFWGTDEDGNPGWREVNVLSLLDFGNGAVFTNPQSDANGKETKALKIALMPAAAFNVFVRNYQNNISYENNTKGAVCLAFVGEDASDSHLIISFDTGNVYQYNRHLTGKDKCAKLLGSFDYNTKESDGIVKIPKTDSTTGPERILYDAYKTWCVDANGNPEWALPMFNKVQSFIKETFLYDSVGYFSASNLVVDLDLSEIVEGSINGLLIDSLLGTGGYKAQIWMGLSEDVGMWYRQGIQNGVTNTISYGKWHRMLNETDLENIDLSDYAPIDSPEFSGIPTAPTASEETNTDQIATTKFVKTIINSLINGAPETLDTLKELADAIENNEDIVEALNDAIGKKVDKEEGKGLSTNDFTDEDKAAAHAQPDWNVTSTTSPKYIQNKPDLESLGYLPTEGGTLSTDGISMNIDGHGIEGSGVQNLTDFDEVSAVNVKGDALYYNDQDTDKRYRELGVKAVDSDFIENFKNEVFTNANVELNVQSFISTFRTLNTTPPSDNSIDQYSAGLAWGVLDTHGYIMPSYNSRKVYVGGGGQNKINWFGQLGLLNEDTELAEGINLSTSPNDFIVGGKFKVALFNENNDNPIPTKKAWIMSFGYDALYGKQIAICPNENNDNIYFGRSFDSGSWGNWYAIGVNGYNKTINLSDSTYDQDTWYPIVGSTLPNLTKLSRMQRISIYSPLNTAFGKPSWSTHNVGFSAYLDAYILPSVYGATYGSILTLCDDFRFYDGECPIAITQYIIDSKPVIWLRGGGSYIIRTDYYSDWQIITDEYGTINDVVKPTNHRPVSAQKRSLISADLLSGFKVYDYATENITLFSFLNSDFRTLQNLDLGTADYKWKNIYATNGVIQTSDRNEKDLIIDLSDEKAESLVYGSKPSTYMIKNGTSGRIHWGFISQDVEQLLEDLDWSSLDFAGFIKSPKTRLITKDENGNELEEPYEEVVEGEFNYSLRYDEFIAPAYKVLQIHKRKIDEQQIRINELESEMLDLKNQVKELLELLN